jgi:uncharacterized protein YecT (DUF1311 family)
MQLRFIAIVMLFVVRGALAAEAITTPKGFEESKDKVEFSMTDSGCGGEGNLADVQCLGRYLRWLDVEMNRVYRLALNKLPERDAIDNRREREQLRKSQRAWLSYKGHNCALIGAMEGGSNLWVTHFAALCEEREIKERISFLKGVAGNE